MSKDSNDNLPIYLDCAATTPIDKRVLDTINYYLSIDYGNAGSHNHIYGSRASKAVEEARKSIAKLAGCEADEVYFTSGATEANNLAILGLANAARLEGKTHFVTTTIEHKAVLEPFNRLEEEGFDITYIKPDENGVINADEVTGAVRDDTYLISIMHVNNETGVIQPLNKICQNLINHSVYIHTDSSQGFGKEKYELNERIDLLSISAHKIYGPKGVGALVARRRNYKRPPITPLIIGGGQEKGLRSGTLPVHLCAGFGKACQLMFESHIQWEDKCIKMQNILLDCLDKYSPVINGDMSHKIPCIINISFETIDSEAFILGMKDIVSISNGSACTTNGRDPSHVLDSMKLSNSRKNSATRWSWCHMTPPIPVEKIKNRISELL